MKQIATGLVLISLFLTFSAFTSLKEGKITGKIIDKNNHEPVAFAAVIVRALPDSIVKFTSLTDTLGTFAFDAVPEGNYVISTQMVGYKPVTTEKIEIQAAKTHEVGEINLENFELKTIVVNGKRPFIEQKADRTVLNVEGSINSSGESAYEIVKKRRVFMSIKMRKLAYAANKVLWL